MNIRELFGKIAFEVNFAALKQTDAALDSTKKRTVGLEGTISKFSKGASGSFNRFVRGLRMDLDKAKRLLQRNASAAAKWGARLRIAGATAGATFKKATSFLKQHRLAILATVTALSLLTFGVIRAGQAYEDSFLGILKVTDGLGDSLEKLTPAGKQVQQQFFELSRSVALPINELLRFGAVGGQLGVAEKDLARFAETMGRLSVSIEGIDTEQAALQIARLDSILNDGNADYDRIGAAVVELGNNFAAMEGPIIDNAINLTALSANLGLTLPQVLGWATAIEAVGGEAAAASTGLTSIAIEMKKAVDRGGKELKTFAETAGVTGDEFKRIFTKDGSEALSMFIQGLTEMEKQGELSINVLEELGLADRRIVRELAKLGGGIDQVNRAIETANTGFEENQALVDESEKRFNSLSGLLQLAKNAMNEIGIVIEQKLNDTLKDSAKSAQEFFLDIKSAFEDAPDLMTGFKNAVKLAAPILGDVFAEIGKQIQEAAPIIGDALAEILPPIITTLATTLGQTLPSAAIGIAKGLLIGLWQFVSNPSNWLMVIGAVVGGVAAAVAGLPALGIAAGALLIAGLFDGIKDSWDAIKQFFIDGFNSIFGYIGQIISKFTGGIQKIFSGDILGGLSDIGSALFDASPIGAAVNAVGSIFGGGKADNPTPLDIRQVQSVTPAISTATERAQESSLLDRIKYKFDRNQASQEAENLLKKSGKINSVISKDQAQQGVQNLLQQSGKINSVASQGTQQVISSTPSVQAGSLQFGSVVGNINVEVSGDSTSAQRKQIADDIVEQIKARKQEVFEVVAPLMRGDVLLALQRMREHRPVDQEKMGQPTGHRPTPAPIGS